MLGCFKKFRRFQILGCFVLVQFVQFEEILKLTNCGASGGICFQFRREAANEKSGEYEAEIALYQKKMIACAQKKEKTVKHFEDIAVTLWNFTSE